MVKEFSSAAPAGAENALAGVAIQLDGQVFECAGRLSVLDMSELAAKAIEDATADAAEAASIYKTLQLAFGGTWPGLRAHIREHQTADETVLGILQYVNEAVQANIERITERPTRPSSSSSDGLEGKENLPVRSISLSKGTVTTGDQAPDGQPEKPARTPKPRKPPTTVRRTG
jgi:hypothetical protein